MIKCCFLIWLQVTIRVLDKNDNPPVIDFHTSAIFVSEATSFGAEIFDISEATKDMDAESQLEYKLINCFNCHDNTFEVDTYTGKVFLKVTYMLLFFIHVFISSPLWRRKCSLY